MTADEILSIPLDRPERLFSAPTVIDQEFRALAREWHPDTNPDVAATKVTAHLSALRTIAHDKVKQGTWREDGVITIRAADGRSFRVRFEMERSIEAGKSFYGRSALLWQISSGFADLTKSVQDRVAKLNFASERMETEMRKYLPSIAGVHKCADGSVGLVLTKTDDVFMLDDVRLHLGGAIDPRHVAWVMSGVYNIACYFEFSGLCHGGITPDSVFVSPKHHSVMLYGGWWYATPVGEKLRALPRSIHSVTPPDVLREKKASPIIDTASIRLLGRSLLGDPTGMTLRSLAPEPMVRFLRSPASPSAREDYANWQKAIGESFGARRFVDLKITASDIFEKEK